ncbi:MAG: hypothetical protein ACMG55_04515 [Microcoleus sp.]
MSTQLVISIAIVRDRGQTNEGDGNAVSLPQNNVVGKRQCRLLIS